MEATQEAMVSAKAAGLKYVSCGGAGIARRKAGHGFAYLRGGRPIRDEETLKRIRALVIPPAWTDVWICHEPNGHLQATGRDARGRKQYRYHPRWRAQRDDTKYGRMIAFGKVLPRLRAQVAADLGRTGLPREKVLATVVRLLQTTLIRVGNEEYARENRSYGLTTMKDKHVAVSGAEVRFRFRGKSGKDHEIKISDPKIARIVRRCRDLPGYELFQYIDDSGENQTVDSADVNEYIRASAGEEFTAKDFRTWAGTVLAATALCAFEGVESQGKAKKNIVAAIEQVAGQLGNTVAVCRKSYIHPAVIDSYLDGDLPKALRRRVGKRRRGTETGGRLAREETAVLALLERRLAGDQRGDRLERQLRKSIRKARSARSVGAPERRAA
ncbi:MAG TPA: DNA topoisomerase IB [Polyangia bacterium]|nr:DNA topoisomerase IB [Polyangia bacterium]